MCKTSLRSLKMSNLTLYQSTMFKYSRISFHFWCDISPSVRCWTKREEHLPTKWFHSASSAACWARQPFITLAHMSPQASTLPGIPLQDGQAVILVNAAAHSGDDFSCNQRERDLFNSNCHSCQRSTTHSSTIKRLARHRATAIYAPLLQRNNNKLKSSIKHELRPQELIVTIHLLL